MSNSIRLSAVATETMMIPVHYTESEREKMQFEYVELSMKAAKLKEDKAAAAADFNAQLKPVLKDRLILMRDLRKGFREEDATVYLIPDQENSIMQYMTEDGTIQKTRRLRPDEKQTDFLRAIHS